MEKEKRVVTILSAVAFMISLATFVFTPMTGDLHVFLASSRQADYLDGNWVWNALNEWELKGELNRLFNYVLYKVISQITGFSNYSFEVGINLMYAFIIMFVIGISIKIAFGKFFTSRNILVFFAGCTAFYATLPQAHIQAEMNGVLCLVMAFAIYVNVLRTGSHVDGKVFLTGLLLGMLFFFKSVTVLMAASFTAAVMLWCIKKRQKLNIRRFVVLVMGGCCLLIGGCLVILFIHPEEFQDMRDAAVYQNTLFGGASISFKQVLKKFVEGFLYACLSMPAVLLGFFGGLKNFADNIREKNFFAALLRVVLWGVPMFIVSASNKYFPYHYILFIFTGMIEIGIAYPELLNEKAARLSNKKIIVALLLVLVGFFLIRVTGSFHNYNVWLILCGMALFAVLLNDLFIRKRMFDFNIYLPLICCSIVYLGFISVFSVNFRSYIDLTNQMYADNEDNLSKLDDEAYTMYLDDGWGAYMLGNRSWLKEYFPLPLQRIREGSQFEDYECHIKAMNAALAYEGKYITTYTSWFFGSNSEYNKAIQNKIRDEYEQIGEVAIYSVPSNIFADDVSSTKRIYEIYEKRK